MNDIATKSRVSTNERIDISSPWQFPKRAEGIRHAERIAQLPISRYGKALHEFHG